MVLANTHVKSATTHKGFCVIDGLVPLDTLAKEFPQRYPFLLESTAKSENTATSNTRFDILFAFPQGSLVKHADEKLSWNEQMLEDSQFLTKLDSLWRAQQIDTLDLDLPFCGGWFLFLSYELVAEIETVLTLPDMPRQIPVAMATRIPAAIICDRFRNQTFLITEPAYANYLEQMQLDVASLTTGDKAITHGELNKISEEPPARYLNAVDKILNYIQAGDVFQVNLSREWQATFTTSETRWDVYARLRQSNPAPFAGVAQFNDTVVFSSSPERLVRVKNKRVETRPIAGTRPRTQDPQQDIALQQELMAHPKERAEHIMLIDLERNDLGRLCEPGSVRVDELMTLESYAHVHHIVSNVMGRLRPNTSPADVIRAVFPGGTITGCPKVRCMQIIAELEQSVRGAYTGSMGYLEHNGNMDLNILIRTMTQIANSISLRAGAGIVADSIPEKELEETRAKAKGMLMALQNGIGI